MRTKLYCVFLLSMLLTVFSGAAFAADYGKTGSSQANKKQLLKAFPKTVALVTGQGKISGKVIDRQSSAPLSGIEVTAHPQTAMFCTSSGGSATTDANGEYTIAGLAGGPYKVEFRQNTQFLAEGEPTYVTQWYNNTLDENLAAIVQVTEPNTTSGINAALDLGGSISGTVTCPSGADMSSFSISVVGATTGYAASTSATYMPLVPMPGFDGSYTLAGLPSDTYTVSFSNPYASSQTGGSAARCISKDDLLQVIVSAPNNKPNINATLAVGGSITGKLVDSSTVPISGVMVSAVTPGSSVTFIGEHWGSSDATGTFTVSGLPSGTYDVIINGRMISDYSNPSSPVHKGYILQKVTNQSVTAPGSKDIGTRTLQPGGKISGTVTSSIDGKAIKDVSVIGYDNVTDEWISWTLTDADGAYTLTGFDTGSDKVQFVACQGNYAEQWYNDKPSKASANPVEVTAPSPTTTGINGTLKLAGTSDTTPPVTIASPAGATYSTPQTVTLTANEPATIYYTTNGNDPTTASPVYSSPLTISTSTTLKFFARDTAGNSEAIKSQAYIITPVVNGDCGSANGGTFATPPPAADLCSAGTASTVTESSTWNWSCLGSSGGTNDACSANKSTVTTKPGDCDGVGGVTIAEVQSAINMFLGIKTVEACVDQNGIGGVTIDEVQKVINGFLGL